MTTRRTRLPHGVLGGLRRAWRRKDKALLVVIASLPRSVGPPVASRLAVVFERLLAVRGGSASLPQLVFVARLAASQRDRAEEVARRYGLSDSTALVARRELMQLAAEADMRDVATQILRSSPEDPTPAYLATRARLERWGGMYVDALEHARRAATAGVASAAAEANAIEGRLAVLQPGWLPDLGTDGQRLTTLRGQASRGRILHLVSASLPYRVVGYTVRTQSVARCQMSAGLEPHVATRAGFPGNAGHRQAPDREIVGGVPYHHLLPDFRSDRPDRGLTAGAKAAIELIESLRPAALQPASNHLMAQSALALARPLGIPVVYEVRGFWEESWAAERWHDEELAMATDRYRLTRAAETAAMLAADAVVTLSEVMRAEIVARGCDPARVVVVPNAVEEEEFIPGPRDATLGAALGIEPGDLVVGYVSSLTAYEGIPGLLEAVADLRGRFTSIRALIVGDGPDAGTIRSAAHRLGLDDGTLIMPGRVPHDEVARYYSLIDVFVVPRTPSRVGSLVSPLKPFEAMALQRALVVSDLPALLENVSIGQTGLVYRAGDRAHLAEVLGTLLDDPHLRATLGAQAREWVLANRTWSANGRRYRALFERLEAA